MRNNLKENEYYIILTSDYADGGMYHKVVKCSKNLEEINKAFDAQYIEDLDSYDYDYSEEPNKYEINDENREFYAQKDDDSYVIDDWGDGYNSYGNIEIIEIN